MPKLLKIVLLLAAVCFALLLALGLAGYFWFKSNKGELEQRAAAARAEASRFAPRHSAKECVDESLTKLSSCSGLGCEMHARMFLGECLRWKKPLDTEFCRDVPRSNEILASLGWRMDRCEEHGLEDDQGCPRMLEEWQRYCAGER